MNNRAPLEAYECPVTNVFQINMESQFLTGTNTGGGGSVPGVGDEGND